ncbi:hypothetical protein Ocin01_01094, partial [Orchesella cincta]
MDILYTYMTEPRHDDGYVKLQLFVIWLLVNDATGHMSHGENVGDR